MFQRLIGAVSAVSIAVLIIGAPDDAHAVSAGCASLPQSGSVFDGGTVIPIGGLVMEVGETISVAVTVTLSQGNNYAASVDLGGAATDNRTTAVVIANGSQTFTENFLIGVAGTYSVTTDFAGGAVTTSFVDQVSYTLTCIPVGGTSSDSTSLSESVAAVQQSSQRRSVGQNTRMVGERLRQLRSARTPQLRAPTTTASAEQPTVTFTGHATSLNQGNIGMAAGDGTSPWGVWGSVGWTGFDDSSQAAPADGNVITGLFGIDYAPNEMIIVGGAVGFDNTYANTLNEGNVSQTMAVFNAYGSFALDEIFSATAFGGVQIGAGEIDSNANTTTGEFNSQRYFIGGSANADLYFGNFSLISSATLLWSQAFTGSFVDSAGVDQSGTTSDLGTFSLQTNPGYLVLVDPDSELYMEPYAAFGYSIDYAQTKIETQVAGAEHPNDRDAFTIGMGLNVFAGDNISANVEATTELGREDFTSTSVFATGRMKF